MAVIDSLPADVVCFTPASNPVKSLVGLTDEEFAAWPTSPEIPQKLMAAFGRKDTVVGLRITAVGALSFRDNPKLRLFITHENAAAGVTKLGGVRVQFKVREQPIAHTAPDAQSKGADTSGRQAYRKWTDSTGSHTVEAMFLDFKDGKVQLKTRDGEVKSVPVEKLSKEDQDWVRHGGAVKPAEGVKTKPATETSAAKAGMALELKEGQAQYTASGMTGTAMSFNIVNGKMVYEPTPLTCPVRGIFQGKTYHATFQGVQGAESGADPMMAPAMFFQGSVKGSVVVVGDLSWNPSPGATATTKCRIVAQDPSGRYLVEGITYFYNRPIVVGPGAIIENARSDKQDTRVTDASGKEHTLAFGHTATLDSQGTISKWHVVGH
jgi:hypothetical protein